MECCFNRRVAKRENPKKTEKNSRNRRRRDEQKCNQRQGEKRKLLLINTRKTNQKTCAQQQKCGATSSPSKRSKLDEDKRSPRHELRSGQARASSAPPEETRRQNAKKFVHVLAKFYRAKSNAVRAMSGLFGIHPADTQVPNVMIRLEHNRPSTTPVSQPVKFFGTLRPVQ